MSHRYLSFAVFILFFLLVKEIPFHYFIKKEVAQKDPPQNGEALLAKGEKLDLCSTDLYELQLITGISYELAERLLEKKQEIAQYEETLPQAKKYEALKIVHGIGTVKAKTFSKYISTKKCTF